MKNPPSRFFVAVNTPSSGSAGALARICGGRGRPRSHWHRVRNRLAMDLFNSYSRLPYSTSYDGRHGIVGNYVEVWTEGHYAGLYCLTDRVNRKLLGCK